MQNQETTIAIVAIVVVIIALIVWLVVQRRKSQRLRESFGEEYDRTVETKGGRRDAEAELLDRQERVKSLEIRPLSPNERMRYSADWTETKALFVDSPVEAVARGDRIITNMMDDRGYPMGDFERRHGDLTVEHQDVAKHYLAGHEIARRSGEATTEELRRGFNHYENLFKDLIGTDDDTHDDHGYAEDRPVKPEAASRPATTHRTD
ncbi:hypothetical protein E3U23_08360 [Erythrobacter litoralis]|uniref:hypothetical protein n=1 Tax=Erythrobacter litoralis TaxID=39960 RepID=UPI002434BFEF|nr:hypothetical protein [Erythrobacter litoralis]MDG6079205.1 hypothetical protein [Erythrobacter litoralis]